MFRDGARGEPTGIERQREHVPSPARTPSRRTAVIAFLKVVTRQYYLYTNQYLVYLLSTRLVFVEVWQVISHKLGMTAAIIGGVKLYHYCAASFDRQAGKTRRSMIFRIVGFVPLLSIRSMSASRPSASTPDSRRVPLFSRLP